MRKLMMIWVLLGPEELVALAAFLATVAVWTATLSALFG
jgi:hypothetical protein